MFPDLTQRSSELELMDKDITSFDAFDTCLRQIEKINSLTLSYRPVFLWLEKYLLPLTNQPPLTIMDIGCGRGELLRRIWKWAKHRKVNIQLSGIDINPWSKPAAENATPPKMPIQYQSVNIFESDLALKADLIVCSHVTHHMNNEELVRFLKWLDDHASTGWFIIDLHRHLIPYWFIKTILWVLPVNNMVRNDGPISVKRAFVIEDWQHLLKQAGIPPSQCRIQWFFPFRYGVTRDLTQQWEQVR